ncbi:cupin domain-containing protein [Brucella rhizosphaerae]|uniref:AraC-like ligand binding domain protein n=1 Tax=Brucella rhizosphaerae TaxID=571254 RepID=A0A256F4G8_9HYPH|nr:cupin domain-containing protein [Brucella rhizosphaerae]OYR09747.1 araC-like ligand binding domain protein [Brucella rhizosphaerae]
MNKVTMLSREDWEKKPDMWHGSFEGKLFGTGASVIFYATEEVGRGPGLHRHPYDEIFIVRSGRALFTVGDEQFEAEQGSVVFGAANIAHKYVNVGPGLLEMIDIHVSGEFIQEDLE